MSQNTRALIPSDMVSHYTGIPCEICGWVFKHKNKSRERREHLAMKHYLEQIETDLAASAKYSCPMCEYIGKDNQEIVRHYTRVHKVLDKYISDDIKAARTIKSRMQNDDE